MSVSAVMLLEMMLEALTSFASRVLQVKTDTRRPTALTAFLRLVTCLYRHGIHRLETGTLTYPITPPPCQRAQERP